jgi:hypothetical protein
MVRRSADPKRRITKDSLDSVSGRCRSIDGPVDFARYRSGKQSGRSFAYGSGAAPCELEAIAAPYAVLRVVAVLFSGSACPRVTQADTDQ